MTRLLFCFALLCMLYNNAHAQIPYDSYVTRNGGFQQGMALKYQMTDNVLFNAFSRFTVTSSPSLILNGVFNGVYDEAAATVSANTSLVITIDFTGKGGGTLVYPSGYIYVHFYYNQTPSSVSGRIMHQSGTWSDLTNWTNITTFPNGGIYRGRISASNYQKIVELTITAGSADAKIAEIEYVQDRIGQFEPGMVTKFSSNTLYDDLSWRNNANTLMTSIHNNGNAEFGGIITGSRDAIFNGLNIGRGNNNISTNVRIGTGLNVTTTTSYSNVSVGTNALDKNTDGNSNTAIGKGALMENTTGLENTAIGQQAIWKNTTGISNVAIGSSSLTALTDGNNNTSIGTLTLANNIHGTGNVALGYGAGAFSTTSNKLFIGNTTTTNLIYGDFSAKNVVINTDGSGSDNDGKTFQVKGTSSFTADMFVKGNIRTKRVIVSTTGFPDYVFEPSYKLPSLDSVEAFIRVNKHLPEVPAAKIAEADGIDVSEMQKILLKKIEELTLYLIESKKRSNEQQVELNEIKKENKRLKEKIEKLQMPGN